MRYMGKDSIWKSSRSARILSVLGAFPVHRGTADREALTAVHSIIERGEPLVLFPEGTRQSGPDVQPAVRRRRLRGVAATGVPIVPVGIGGSEAAMPKGVEVVPAGQGRA